MTGAVAVAAVAALAGCSGVNAALAKQWAVVNFRPDTTVATLLKVRAACSHVPHVQPLTLSAVSSDLNINYSVRYKTSKATGSDLAALRTCLEKYPAVTGVTFQDQSLGG
jgi:hypothetical protein